MIRDRDGTPIVRQSDIASYNRCPQQYHLDRLAREDPNQPPPDVLSATVFGTVMHHAGQVLQRLMLEGREDALAVAQQTFEHYWHPDNIDSLPGAQRVTAWIPRQTYGGLRLRGLRSLEGLYEFLTGDRTQLLALELAFRVRLTLGGGLGDVIATGTVDRLVLRKQTGPVMPYLGIDDLKGLPLDTPIPTPSGWTTMGGLRVGDQIFGSSGELCQVVRKSAVHLNPCYRISFDDGSSIVADQDHRWEVLGGRAGREWAEIFTTKEMLANLHGEKGQRHLRIINAQPLDLPEVALPIDPYVFGCWLGDGNKGRGVICKPDDDLFREIERRGYTVGSNCYGARSVYGLQKSLRAMGMLGHKEIPTIYLRASRAQRLDLLRGLMDTDGTWNRPRKQAVIRLMDRQLLEQVYELVVSLGWRATFNAVRGTGLGKEFTSWNLAFTPQNGVNPFVLPRKAALVQFVTHRSWRRLVLDVQEVPTVATQCIEVDSPNSMYLAGRQMVPTHNSGSKPTYLQHAFQWTYYALASTRPEFWRANWDEAELERLLASIEKYGVSLFDGDGLSGPLMPRRGRWLALTENFDVHDCGWRTDGDFGRAMLAVKEFVRANDAEVFPLNIVGSVCEYCPHSRNGSCGGRKKLDTADRYPTIKELEWQS